MNGRIPAHATACQAARDPAAPAPRLGFGACALLLGAAMLAGCGPARVTLDLQGVTPMNLNEQNESTSVQVRFYQLKTDATFRAATVDQLWTDDKKVLGADLVGDPSSTFVQPAGAGDPPAQFAIDVQDAAKFIGVLALFHKADAEDHRMLLIPVDEAGKHNITFTGYAVSLAKDEPAAKGK